MQHSRFPSGLIQRTLDNGLVFVARPNPRMPVTSTMLWYRVGSAHELPGKTGVAHFLEHMMFKGTARLRQGRIDQLTQRFGGVNNAFTWLDSTAYYFNFGQDRWKLALQIEAERMHNCLLDAREFELEKAVILEERSSEMDLPEGVLFEEVNRAAFSSHSYGQPIIGWLEDLRSLRPQDLRDFYDAYYVPNNAHLVMVGDFDVEEAFEHVRRQFGELPARELPESRRIVEPPQRAERRVCLERESQAPLLSLAYHVPPATHPDAAPLTLLDLLLTTGRTSRLHERLVEKEKIASSVDSAYYDTAHPYLFWINIELHPGKSLEHAESMVLEELERLAAEPLPKEELAKAKKLFEADWVLDHQTAEDQATHIGEALGWGDLEILQAFPDRVEATRRQDVRRVLEHYFQRSNRTVGHLIPATHDHLPVQIPPPREAPKTPTEVQETESPGGVEGVAPLPAPRRAPPAPVKGLAPAELPGLERWRLPRMSRALPRVNLEVHSFTLGNGLRVACVQDDSVPCAFAELTSPIGALYEADAQAGRAALLGRMLAEGTSGRTAQQIAQSAERRGAKFETSGAFQHVHVGVEVLFEDLAYGLDLISDVARRSNFPEPELEARRQEQLTAIARAKDDVRKLGQQLFYELIYGKHPGHRPILGYSESVGPLRREDLLQPFERAFSPSSCFLTLAGDLGSMASIERQVEAAFGDWEGGGSPSVVEIPAAPRPRQQLRILRKSKEQTHLFLGHLGLRRQDPDYEAALVLDHVLGTGAGFTDRLSQRLRDREGLAYTVFASLTRHAGPEPGVFLAYIGTSPDKVGQALAGMLEEIERIRQEAVPSKELEQVKAYIVGQYPFNFQTGRDRALYLQGCHLYGWPFDRWKTFLEAIEAVQPEDILRVAQRRLHPEALTLVATGPLQKSALRLP